MGVDIPSQSQLPSCGWAWKWLAGGGDPKPGCRIHRRQKMLRRHWIGSGGTMLKIHYTSGFFRRHVYLPQSPSIPTQSPSLDHCLMLSTGIDSKILPSPPRHTCIMVNSSLRRSRRLRRVPSTASDCLTIDMEHCWATRWTALGLHRPGALLTF